MSERQCGRSAQHHVLRGSGAWAIADRGAHCSWPNLDDQRAFFAAISNFPSVTRLDLLEVASPDASFLVTLGTAPPVQLLAGEGEVAMATAKLRFRCGAQDQNSVAAFLHEFEPSL